MSMPNSDPPSATDRMFFRQGRGDDLLALVAARLVVVLDAVRALRLEPAHMGERIVIGFDLAHRRSRRLAP